MPPAPTRAIQVRPFAEGRTPTARWFTDDRKERIAFLFTVSKKEFSIAAAFVAASGLPIEITIPAVFFTVIQMITSPLAARMLAGGAPAHATDTGN